MPQTIIRPNALVDSAGFDLSGTDLVSAISDGEFGTGVNQNQTAPCYLFVDMTNPEAEEISPPINYIKVIVVASSNKTGESNIVVELWKEGMDSYLQSSEFALVDIVQTKISDKYYGYDGEEDFFDLLRVKITPDEEGSSIYEVYIEITHGEVPTSGLIQLNTGLVKLNTGKVTL